MVTFSASITNRTILMCDYSNSFIGDPNFSKVCKWATWNVSSNANKTFYTLQGWDTGINLSLLASAGDGATYVYNGISATKETVILPLFQSSYVQNDEQDIIHIGAVRYNVQGLLPLTPVNLFTTIVSGDQVTNILFPTIPITSFMKNSPTVIGNAVVQKALVKVNVPDDGYFNINKMFVFVKSMYSSFPG